MSTALDKNQLDLGLTGEKEAQKKLSCTIFSLSYTKKNSLILVVVIFLAGGYVRQWNMISSALSL